MKYFLIGLLIGLGALTGYVVAANLPTKHASSNYDMEGVILYAYTSTNALVPVLADSSGSLLTASGS